MDSVTQRRPTLGAAPALHRQTPSIRSKALQTSAAELCPRARGRRSAATNYLAALGLVAAMQGCEISGGSNDAATAQARAQLVATLSAQADRWDQAIVRKDRAAIESNMAADFRQIDGQGALENKQSFVDGLMSAELEIQPYTIEDFDVRVYGETALITGRTRMTGKYQGKPFATHYRYTDVYIRQGEEWKIVSVQISKIPGA